MQPEEMLPDGTPCKTGFCNKGVCEPTMTDIVVRIWGFFEDFNLGSVMRFLKVNIISSQFEKFPYFKHYGDIFSTGFLFTLVVVQNISGDFHCFFLS